MNKSEIIAIRVFGIVVTTALVFNFYLFSRVISVVEKLQQDIIMIAEPSEDCPHRDMGVI